MLLRLGISVETHLLRKDRFVGNLAKTLIPACARGADGFVEKDNFHCFMIPIIGTAYMIIGTLFDPGVKIERRANRAQASSTQHAKQTWSAIRSCLM